MGNINMELKHLFNIAALVIPTLDNLQCGSLTIVLHCLPLIEER